MNDYRFTPLAFFLATISLAIAFALPSFSDGAKQVPESRSKQELPSSNSYIVYDDATQLDITNPNLSKMLPSSDGYLAWHRHLTAMCGVNRACQKAVDEHLQICVNSAPNSNKAFRLNHLIECVSNHANFPRSRFLKGWVGARKTRGG